MAILIATDTKILIQGITGDFGGRHASGGEEVVCDPHDPGPLHGLRAAGENPSDGECRRDGELHGALDPR